MKKFASSIFHAHTEITLSQWSVDIAHAKSPLRFILTISRPYKRWAIATLVLGAFANGVGSLIPIIYKHIVDSITALTAHAGSYTTLYLWLFAYVGIHVFSVMAWRVVS